MKMERVVSAGTESVDFDFDAVFYLGSEIWVMKVENMTKAQLIEELNKLRQREEEVEGIEIEHKQAEEALQKAHDELEERIEERTAELQKRNQELEEKDRLLTAFHQIGQITLASLNGGQILDNLAQQIIQIGVFRSLMIALVHEEAQTVEVVCNYSCIDEKSPHPQDREIKPTLYMKKGYDAVREEKIVGMVHALDDDAWTARAARTGELIVQGGYGHHLLKEPKHAEMAEKVAYFIPVKQGDRVLAVLATGSEMADKEVTLRQIEVMQPLLGQVAIALEHAHLFAQLRALSHRLVEVQEEERRALSRELHDEIGQELTGLKMFLEMIANTPADDLSQHLENAHQTVGRLMDQVRHLSRMLRPSVLDDLGLLPALQLLFRTLHEQTGLQVNFRHLELDGRLSPDTEIGAYRIVQESLNNAIRHAGVPQVRVRVWVTSDQLDLRVEDEGRGFDPKVHLGKGMGGGLRGMQERALLLGGEVRIESTPGAGTRIAAELPLEKRSPAEP